MMVNFPILHRVKVDNYALYIGNDNQKGLDHSFTAGVNVIVGINGLGKTTLLNILLRCLTGPLDIPAGGDLGDKARKTVPISRSWFSERVPDNAVNATVTLEFDLGEHFILIKRSLANLDIKELLIDQQPVSAGSSREFEEKYHKEIVEHSLLNSFDDFVFLLRYVVFFLDDRRSLVWDQSAQTEILSILFGESTSDRTEYVELINELYSLDSEYRNVQSVFNKLAREHQRQASSIGGGEIDMLIKELAEKRARLDELRQPHADADKSRNEFREKIDEAQRSLYEERAELTSRLSKFYDSFFPMLNCTEF
jgi:predicted ATP-dependent endonuclease of OLD family